MSLPPSLKAALIGGAVAALAGCSVGEIFPDKQKTYRYSNELPDLEIPPDLNAQALTGEDSTSLAKRSQYASGKQAASSDSPAKPAGGEAANKRKPVRHDTSSMTLAESLENTALIEMQEPYDEAWNDVGRALGRLKVEINDQNRSDGVYYIYYGGVSPKKAGAETTFWDDVGSVFSGDKDTAQEYRIKLEDKGSVTNVTVTDASGVALSDGPALELLKRLHKKLITLDQPDVDTDDSKPEAKPKEDEEEKP